MKEKELLEETVKAWESLPVNMMYSSIEIVEWLLNDIKPVIDKIKKYLTN